MPAFADDALADLKKGNKAFVATEGPGLQKHGAGQSPKAVVVACSDSRVVPERIFGQGIGDIFVVRVAGNVATMTCSLQSIEYAVEHLDVKLIVIMGHTRCGAVEATEKLMAECCDTPGLLGEIKASFECGDDHVRANIQRQMDMLPQASDAIQKAMSQKGDEALRIVGAIYDIESGNVEYI